MKEWNPLCLEWNVGKWLGEWVGCLPTRQFFPNPFWLDTANLCGGGLADAIKIDGRFGGLGGESSRSIQAHPYNVYPV